ncbi:hypothetical protein CTI14_50505, partial [Methylobacterium radiotolerans]
LGLSGCSAQLSTKDSCAQYQSIEKNVSTLGGTPSSSQVSGVASQTGRITCYGVMEVVWASRGGAPGPASYL